MTPWWEIRYFQRDNGLRKANSAMLPFKLLPELDRMDIRNGHKFKTDEFEIEIPGAGITLHMPTKSLWIDGRPYHVEGASRVILFIKNFISNDGSSWRHIYLGLMTDMGRGLIIKYDEESKTSEISVHPDGTSYEARGNIPSLPAFQDLEKD
jgi:hypothetical protein